MNKPSLPPRIAPLQRVVAQPVTDPVELAAIEELCKRRLPQTQNGQEQQEHPESQSEMVWQVIALCRQLPQDKAAWLLNQVAGLLSAEEMLAWTENLLHHLPQDALAELEKQLSERLTAKPVSK